MGETAMEVQRRRTLDALQRRVNEEKAEILMMEQKNNKSKIRCKEQDKDTVGNSSRRGPKPTKDSNASSRKGPKPTKDSNASSRKGHIHFVGPSSISRKDGEANDPSYLKLSHGVHEKLLTAGEEVSDRKNAVNGVLHSLFQHGDLAQKYMQGSKSLKIENTILLDNFVRKTSFFGDRSLKELPNGSKRSKKHFSLTKHKKIGSFDLPKKFQNFEIFKPMHEKWKSYVQQLLKISGKDNLPQSLFNADLHGAIILVVECKLAACVGIHGIVIRETKETFGIITPEDKFRVVPKKSSVFILQADCWKITIYGDKLASRSLVP